VRELFRCESTAQKWIELRDQSQDPYTALEILVVERIRCATQLNRELANDIESHDIGFETKESPI
jgi:hypothetical protein